MRSDRLLAAGVALAALLAASEASAFCRRTTAGVNQPTDPDGCATSGEPLYHASQCIPYRMLTRESPVLSNAVISEKLGAAFAAWLAPNPTCTPGIVAIELSPVADAKVADYRIGERYRNIVGVPDTWNHQVSNDELSLATVTFNATTGEIYDADLEINPTIPWSTTDVPPPDGYDLQVVMTHEAGHMLGLAHSPEPEATMFAAYTPGSIDQRTLSDDDQRAVCAVYPNRGQRLTSTGLVPSTACNLAFGDPNKGCGEPDVRYGCSASPAPSTPAVAIAALTLLLSCAARRRRSRSRRSS